MIVDIDNWQPGQIMGSVRTGDTHELTCITP